MIKKTSLALILCTLLCFTQPNLGGRTTVITTVHESPSFLELLFDLDKKLGLYVTAGAITGGIVGLIAYLIEKTKDEHRYY